MNAVLMTHFLIEKHMGLPLILNEFGILAVGMIIGILLNMIMPSNKKNIRKEQLLLEEEIKKTLHSMANKLRDKEAYLIQPDNEMLTRANMTEKQVDFDKLSAELEQLLKSAYAHADNTLLSDTRYLVSYLEMRKLQIEVLKSIRKDIESIPVILKQTFPIANFIQSIAGSFHELNNAEGLLKELDLLKLSYRREALPQTREEFEYRAILFQIMKELEYFLMLKRNFVLELESKNMKSYWNSQE